MEGYEPVDTFDESTRRGTTRSPCAAMRRRRWRSSPRLAGGGPALELAIGTGRIALPLAATGVRVDGVDLSQPMVDQLRAKPGGSEIAVTIGDFCDVSTRRPVRARLRRLQLVLQRAHAGRPGARASRTWRGTSPTTACSSWRSFLPSALIGSATTSTSRPRRSASTRCGSTCCAYDPSPRSSRRTTSRISRYGIRFNPVVQR